MSLAFRDPSAASRILIVDDNPHIHRDFEMALLEHQKNIALEIAEQHIYGLKPGTNVAKKPAYILDHADSGMEGIEKVKQSVVDDRPYQLAFVDVRMPGLDGVETIKQIWQIDSRIQIVICTAYADYSQDDLHRKLGLTDKLLVLKKPFDTIEVTQLARTLTEKWHLALLAAQKFEQMELLVSRRTQKVLDLQRQESHLTDEIEQMRLRFFANLAYEIRGPLAPVVRSLEKMLATGKVDNQQDLLCLNAKRLLLLVSQLQDYWSLEQHKLKFNPTESDLVAFIRGVVLIFQPIAAEQKVELQFQTEGTARNVHFDTDKMEKILFSLLSQSLGFAPRHIKVSVRFTALDVQIRVEADGGGIDAKDLPYVFDPFHRSSQIDPANENRRGIGIGVAVTQKFVQAHGASIRVESPVSDELHLGKERPGTRFTILLPFEVAEKDAASKPAAAKPGSLPEQIMPAIRSGQKPEKKRPPIVLLVESNADVALHVHQILGAENEIATFGDGPTAFEKAREIVPDLVIIDIVKPQIDGVELCRKLKNDQITSHIPVIMFTFHDVEDYQLKALEAGADDYIVKPLNLSVLKARVGNVLESRRRLRINILQETVLYPRELAVNQADAIFLERVTAAVEQNISDYEFDVGVLAKQVSISRRQLFRKLKAVIDMSPMAFIRSLRLRRAAQLILESNKTITEITFAVGFLDLKHFRAVFKEQFGVLPSEYQKKFPSPPRAGGVRLVPLLTARTPGKSAG